LINIPIKVKANQMPVAAAKENFILNNQKISQTTLDVPAHDTKYRNVV
jgi:hypothetical protein